MLTTGRHLPVGLYAFEITRGWSSPFNLQDLLGWMAGVPAASASLRRAWVPAQSWNLRPWLVLDSACAEGVCGRPKANAERGCNILCSAGQREMRQFGLQYTCKPVTRAARSDSNRALRASRSLQLPTHRLRTNCPPLLVAGDMTQIYASVG